MKGKYICNDILMAILARPDIAEKVVKNELATMPEELTNLPAPVRQQREQELQAA